MLTPPRAKDKSVQLELFTNVGSRHIKIRSRYPPGDPIAFVQRSNVHSHRPLFQRPTECTFVDYSSQVALRHLQETTSPSEIIVCCFLSLSFAGEPPSSLENSPTKAWPETNGSTFRSKGKTCGAKTPNKRPRKKYKRKTRGIDFPERHSTAS